MLGASGDAVCMDLFANGVVGGTYASSKIPDLYAIVVVVVVVVVFVKG